MKNKYSYKGVTFNLKKLGNEFSVTVPTVGGIARGKSRTEAVSNAKKAITKAWGRRK